MSSSHEMRCMQWQSIRSQITPYCWHTVFVTNHVSQQAKLLPRWMLLYVLCTHFDSGNHLILLLKSLHLNLNQVSVCFLADSLGFVLQSSAVPSLTQTALSHGHHMLSLSNYLTNRSEAVFIPVAAGSEGYPGSTTPKHWGKLFGPQLWGHISGSGDNFIIHITLHIEFSCLS